MLYYWIGRTARWVGRLPGSVATSGQGDASPGLWPRKSWVSLFHFILAFQAMSQTIGVKPISPVNIIPSQAQAITIRVQEITTRYAETVDRTSSLQDVLAEHALRQSGATNYNNDSLGLLSATRIISGSAGFTGSSWFINLCITDVATGQVLDCKSATTASFQNLLTLTKPVTKALLYGTQIEDDEQVTSIQDNQPIIIGTNKVISEVHVYQHAPGTHDKKRFIPCNFCQGTGEIPCRGNKVCPSGYEDCPYCTPSSSFKGIETHGKYMTGHWEE